MSTTLVHCTCHNDFQDKEYGKQVRVANEVGKVKAAPAKGQMSVKCTVCSKEYVVSEARRR